MTNKEAKEIMSKVTFYWELGEQTLTQNQINEALDMAIKALEQTRWIPCTERLPEDDGWYLCTIQKETETKVAEIRFFEDTKWKAYGWNVIAWMNEPQPYKAESEDKE